ncbi:MAG: hypothetical protein R3C58_05145 [Parvularculaceae bacterium]
MTTVNNLIAMGVACCALALAVQVFPAAAASLGADPGASWLLFGFGVFLILVGALIATGGRQQDAARPRGEVDLSVVRRR